MDGLLETAVNEYPRLAIFYKKNEFFDAKVVGDTCVIHTQADNLVYALLILLGSYYVFNLQYPAMYDQFLGLLQQVIIGVPWDGNKTIGFVQILDKVTKEMEKDHFEGKGKQS